MKQATDFTVPDYMDSFVCKCGNCRHTCCHGWTITMSMREYFMLTGLDCSPELRRKLDCSLYIVDNPTEERYAAFEFDYRGDCKLHRTEDGLCAIQHECGECAITSVCRMYPRGPHTLYANECSCSCGCEAVCEALYREQKLTFSESKLTFSDDILLNDADEFVKSYYVTVRQKFIQLLQNREKPFIERLGALYSLASSLSEGFRLHNGAMVESALNSALNYHCIAMQLDRQKLLAAYYAKKSVSLADYAESVLSRYGMDCEINTFISHEAEEIYSAEAGALYDRFPDLDNYLENLFVNHIFYKQFPFDVPSVRDAADSVLDAYRLIIFLIAEAENTDALIDITAAAFRMIDNSDFDRIAPLLVHENRTDK